MGGGKISICCSNECYNKWNEAGRIFPDQPCILCGKDDHKILQCPLLTAEKKAAMKEHIDYEHTFQYWLNVNNIAKVKNFLGKGAQPQNMQEHTQLDESCTHGVAWIGPLHRRVYFDLGGTFDLIDDDDYVELARQIREGRIPHAQLISPMDIGYTRRGVPIDVAAGTGRDTASVIYVQRWVRITVDITTNSGRKLKLTQATIGFVSRSSPLLILGKRTCAIWGYKSFEQQDKDMRRRDEDDDRGDRPHKTTSATTTKVISGGERAAGKATIEIPISQAAEEPSVTVEIIDEQQYLKAAHQYINIAASDVPSPGSKPMHKANGKSHVSPRGAWTKNSTAPDEGDTQCESETDNDADDINHDANNENETQRGYNMEDDDEDDEDAGHNANDGKRNNHEHHYRYGWRGNDKHQWRNPDQSNQHRQAWLRQAKYTVATPIPTLEAAGKTMRGDTDEDDDEAIAEEADDEDGHDPTQNTGVHGQQSTAEYMESLEGVVQTKPLSGEIGLDGRGAHAQYLQHPKSPDRVRGRDLCSANKHNFMRPGTQCAGMDTCTDVPGRKGGFAHDNVTEMRTVRKESVESVVQTKPLSGEIGLDGRGAHAQYLQHPKLPGRVRGRDLCPANKHDSVEPTTQSADTDMYIDIPIMEDDEAQEAYPQYANIACGQEPLQPVDEHGKDIYVEDQGAVLVDGYIYAGQRAHTEMDGSAFIVTDKLKHSYITTAALRRSGNHPEGITDVDVGKPATRAMEQLCAAKDIDRWIRGSEKPHSVLCGEAEMTIDSTVVLHAFRQPVTLRGRKFIVVPSNELRVVMGSDMAAAVDTELEADASPLQSNRPGTMQGDVQAALDVLDQQVQGNPELAQGTKQKVHDMIKQQYIQTWKGKYDLEQPAAFPPMKIRLKPGAKPSRIKRNYRWTVEQRAFLRKLIRKLVDVGVISKVDSEWCCPVVLALKPDGTWRLCVDPSRLNEATIPMVWEIPKVREVMQEQLSGVRWMCKFDFCAMFWQIPLDIESRRLFSFYAGELGSYQFNRVAMGALNSSIYTQRMVTHMFANVKRADGRPLLGNGLIVQTDDVLLYTTSGDDEAKSQAEMLEILQLFLHTVACHNMAIHPGKCELFVKSTTYCGLRVTRDGITVDPERVAGLLNMPEPVTVGDVWQFEASAGWIREDVPLFSESAAVLTDFRTKALKPFKRKNMAAASKLKLRSTDWGEKEQAAFQAIKDALLQTIYTSYRDRRKKACIFTDASRTGWAYAITQCDPDELNKPWEQQKHELLAVNSGKFRNNQKKWGMPCKEAFPIRHAVERHRHLLAGNLPFTSVNDHKSLTYVLDGPARSCTISVAARERLQRWAEYLRSYTFDTVHIPGAVNHFCDLLSRNGCTQAVSTWEQVKHGGDASSKSHGNAQPQMAIITPTELPGRVRTSTKDLDIRGDDLMLTIPASQWPTPERIAEAQRDAGIFTDHVDNTASTPMFTDAKGRITLPVVGAVTEQVIAVCHQGDHIHRSADETIREFRKHYRLHLLGRKNEEEFLRNRCRKCLSCIKTRTGKTVPRPMWYMVRATRPYEYVHMDYMELPMPVNGKKYVLLITCDFSLTTVICNTRNNDASSVVKALLDHWLSIYPDPDLLHTDGGSHFDNAVIQGLTEARGWAHTICTPYAKWASGVAERNNKLLLDILTPLCEELSIPVNKWPKVLKLVQAAMNRRPRPSRGNMSPIELTTGIKPRTVASMIRNDGGTVDILDEDATNVLNRSAALLAERMETIYDIANAKRRAKSEQNRRRTHECAVPSIDVGDFVLYAEHKKHTKLDYTWLGPAVVTAMVTPLVFSIRPYTLYESEVRDMHISRLRRFAGNQLNVTEQLRLAIERDHPDNIVGKIVGHEVINGTLWMKCRWRGFTAELDSLQTAAILSEDCPDKVKEYYKDSKTTRDDPLKAFMRATYPSMEHEEAIERQRREAGAVAEGRRTQLRRRGRTLQHERARRANANQRNHQVPNTTARRRRTQRVADETPTTDVQEQQRQTRAAANQARDERNRRRNAMQQNTPHQPHCDDDAGLAEAMVETKSNTKDSTVALATSDETKHATGGSGTMESDTPAKATTATQPLMATPTRVHITTGNLLDAEDDIIAHQTNCTSKGVAGLAQQIFARYPHADTYRDRKTPDVPGTIYIMGSPGGERMVANLNAQYYPGNPKQEGKDTAEARVQFFGACLHALAKHIRNKMHGHVTVGLPWRIGCGLAGGDWDTYKRMIASWANDTYSNSEHAVTVNIYQLEPPAQTKNDAGPANMHNTREHTRWERGNRRTTNGRGRGGRGRGGRGGATRGRGGRGGTRSAPIIGKADEIPARERKRLVTGEQAGELPTSNAHKGTRGWTLHAEVRPSHIPGAGDGLFVKEKAKKGERIARYYGELIDAEEAEKRIKAGAQYIVQANAKEFIDAQDYPQQRGRYANDGGIRNNAKIATKINKCPDTGEYWVSILAKKTIQPNSEVYVPYGHKFRRAWAQTPLPAMAAREAPKHTEVPKATPKTTESESRVQTTSNKAVTEESAAMATHPAGMHEPIPGGAGTQAIIIGVLLGIASMPRRAQRRVATLWNSAMHWASKGDCRRKMKACSNFTDFVMQSTEIGTVTTLPTDPGPIPPERPTRTNNVSTTTHAAAVTTNERAGASSAIEPTRNSTTATSSKLAGASGNATSASSSTSSKSTGASGKATSTSNLGRSPAATTPTAVEGSKAGMGATNTKPTTNATNADMTTENAEVHLKINEVTARSGKCAVRGKTTTVRSPLHTLVEAVNKIGRFIPIAMGNNIIIFENDSGTSITQASKTHVRELRSNGTEMLLLQTPTVTWETINTREVLKMKLWLVKNVRILGILEGVSMPPLDIIMLENPRLPDQHAFLGRSTLMAMRLLTNHHTGALQTPGGRRRSPAADLPKGCPNRCQNIGRATISRADTRERHPGS